jgi:hypothetical protein
MVNRLSGIAVGLAVVLGAVSSAAQSRIVTLKPIEISGRVQRPLATVEVARAEPKITLTAIRQPFVERIGQVVARDPY